VLSVLCQFWFRDYDLVQLAAKWLWWANHTWMRRLSMSVLDQDYSDGQYVRLMSTWSQWLSRSSSIQLDWHPSVSLLAVFCVATAPGDRWRVLLLHSPNAFDVVRLASSSLLAAALIDEWSSTVHGQCFSSSPANKLGRWHGAWLENVIRSPQSTLAYYRCECFFSLFSCVALVFSWPSFLAHFNFYGARFSYFRQHVCRVSQKVMNRFCWNFLEGWSVVQGPID